MVIVGLLSWWYGAGWRRRVMAVIDNLRSLYDYFSFDLLIRTLFAPFRQISAGNVQGPVGVQLRAFFDKVLSRIIGSIVRSIVLMIGCVTMVLAVALGALAVISWGILPFAPVAGVIMMLHGWVPWHL